MKTATDLEALLAIAKRGGLTAAHAICPESFGIESVECCGRSLNYLNMGDTYDLTICREKGGEPFIGSWGGWYEEAEAQHCEENDEIRCGYCGEFTECDADDWRETRCGSCGHNVSTGEPMPEPAKCDGCGETLDQDCEGNQRCPDCDGPCPCCSDGGGPGGEENDE